MDENAAPEPIDPAESGLVFALPLGGPDEALSWVKNAGPGDSVIYFIGHLAVARDETSPFGARRAQRADGVAQVMQRASASGHITLTQRRVVDGSYLYIARRAAKKIH